MNTPSSKPFISLKVSIVEQPDQVLLLPHPTDTISLKALPHLPRTSDGVTNLTTPLVNLRKFRATQVDLRMPEGLDSDQYIQRYLQQHHKVFEVLGRAEAARQSTLKELTRLNLQTLMLAGLLALGTFLLSRFAPWNQVTTFLDSPEKWAVITIILTALLISPSVLLRQRLRTIERRFLNGHRNLIQLQPPSSQTPR